MSISTKPKFRCRVGTVQLFIVGDAPSLFVPASLPSYSERDPVGSEWERRVAQWVCDVLNDLDEVSSIVEADICELLRWGSEIVPFVRSFA